MKKKAERSTTSLTIEKEDLPLFNKLKLKEGGRRGASVSQNKFIRFLLCLYQEVDECIKGGIVNPNILHDAEKRGRDYECNEKL